MAVVLVTGGAGYIGAHTTLELLAAGCEVVVLDNLCNGSREALTRVEAISGRALTGFVEGDVRDLALLARLFAQYPIGAVIHFAALKAVGESVERPLDYYENNIGGLLALVRAMQSADVRRLVFSSSATVYGDPAAVPIAESAPTSATNPYGRTKLICEEILADLAKADPAWRIAALRYFNPVGAHRSGRIGEDPAGVPNNLMPYVTQVAVGRRAELQIFGGDYPTADGTGVRDYIHVVDLALGHVRALERLDGLAPFTTINLGTGRGYSVLELVRAFEAASGHRVPYRIVGRRAGDVAQCWADPGAAARLLDWRASRGIEEMCADAWRWQRDNPDGYGSA